MSKGLINSHKFNISCKDCGNEDINATERDGYIYLVCERCDKLKSLKDKDNQIAKKLLLATNIEPFIEVLKDILESSKLALPILKQIAYYLNENCKLFGIDGSHLNDGFLYKKEVFSLANELKDLTILDGFYCFNEKILSIGFTTYKEPVISEWYQGEEGAYDLDSKYMSFDINWSNKFSAKLSEESNIELDTIFVYSEIDGHISVLEKNINQVEEYLKNINMN